MIADSPYKTGELVLKPFVGILGGLTGSVLMIGSITLAEPLSKKSAVDILEVFGSHLPFLTALGLGTDLGRIAAGAFLLVLSGCVLGLFYALSEQRIPVKGLVADGLFYGFILWVFGGVILGSFLGEEIRAILRSWTFLVHTLLYGICLSCFSIVSEGNRPMDVVAPRD